MEDFNKLIDYLPEIMLKAPEVLGKDEQPFIENFLQLFEEQFR